MKLYHQVQTAKWRRNCSRQNTLFVHVVLIGNTTQLLWWLFKTLRESTLDRNIIVNTKILFLNPPKHIATNTKWSSSSPVLKRCASLIFAIATILYLLLGKELEPIRDYLYEGFGTAQIYQHLLFLIQLQDYPSHIQFSNSVTFLSLA